MERQQMRGVKICAPRATTYEVLRTNGRSLATLPEQKRDAKLTPYAQTWRDYSDVILRLAKANSARAAGRINRTRVPCEKVNWDSVHDLAARGGFTDSERGPSDHASTTCSASGPIGRASTAAMDVDKVAAQIADDAFESGTTYMAVALSGATRQERTLPG